MRFVLPFFAGLAAAASPAYLANANDGMVALMRWYHADKGTWDQAQWWQQANIISTLSELAAIDPTFMGNASSVYQSTFHALLGNPTKRSVSNEASPHAPDWGRYMLAERKALLARGNDWSRFDNGLFDDPGWWALAWISAFDRTQDGLYLTVAENILDNILIAEGTPSRCNNGGINWRKNNNYVNAITNELYFSIAASLSSRSSNATKRAEYLQKAQDEWTWFKNSGLSGPNNIINDGLNDACKNDGSSPIWTYNQGVILGGLVELNAAAPSSEYLTAANNIAQAAISQLTNSTTGVLHESCETQKDGCNADQRQFKGIFVRNLMHLHQAAPSDAYKNFFKVNADSVWNNARLSENTFVVDWSGPVTNDRYASSTSSALDAIIAAAATQ